MAARTNRNDKIIDTTLALTVERGWREFSLADVATQSKIAFSDIYQIYPTKTAILAGYIARVDLHMLKLLEAEQPATEPDATPRERLFDVIMARFDVMSDDKPALHCLREAAYRDPTLLVSLARPIRQSLNCILQAAGLEIGTGSRLWRTALVAILTRVSKTWLEDETEDMARTMAALDRQLAYADRLSRLIPRSCAASAPATASGRSRRKEKPAD